MVSWYHGRDGSACHKEAHKSALRKHANASEIPHPLPSYHNTSPHTVSPHLTTTPPLPATFHTAMKKGKAYIFAMHIVNGHVPQAPPSIYITLLAGAAPSGFSSVRLATP